MTEIALLGTVGVPANYGGFETLAENLVRYYGDHEASGKLTVYCSAKDYSQKPANWGAARLRYLRLKANGVQSILYDALSLLDCCRRRTKVVLLLGVSGAMVLPFVRLLSQTRIVTNIDGIEWRREKWTGIAKIFLKLSEKVAVKWSHEVVADNVAIAQYVRSEYGRECCVIAYGGDHALAAQPLPDSSLELPEKYALALCRIEPENNVSMILDAFSQMPEQELVFVGNWDKSDYGCNLRARYRKFPNLHLIDPIYEAGRLRWIRNGARVYIHGHSAGGTNPSLVEMMHFGIPVFAHGCSFNRFSTEEKAIYFESSEELLARFRDLNDRECREIGFQMLGIAQREYTWASIGKAYFDLLSELSEQ